MTFEFGLVFSIIGLAIILFLTEKFTIDTVSISVMVDLLRPVVIRLIKTDNTPPLKLLMPLLFGAIIGGICTLLVTIINILMNGIAEQAGHPLNFIFTKTK
jgi:di/tricarboxylate transporter